jgi:hypothetical protein
MSTTVLVGAAVRPATHAGHKSTAFTSRRHSLPAGNPARTKGHPVATEIAPEGPP